MNILLVGSGAREHAIAWKLRQSRRVDDLFVAPGNAGTARITHNLPVRANDIEGIARAARHCRADLVVVGPEESLALGLADRLTVEGIAVFGPTKAAALIEASKAFAHQLMERHDIPHPQGRVFDVPSEARAYAAVFNPPPVVKADGLAAGKGAIVAATTEEALAAIDAMLVQGAFGEAGRRVLLQERLSGREVSVFAFSDGVAVVPMVPACDYKRALDGDRGPNTGGMGAFSPPPWYDVALHETVRIQVLERTVQAMMAEGRPYRGVLYGGLMVGDEGFKVLEFNCRFGDPEAQVVLPRLKSDLLEIMWAVALNRLHEANVEWSDQACVGVVLASGGYPGDYKTGLPIRGLDDVDPATSSGQAPEVMVFHAGTRLADPPEADTVLTAGGRVLTVVATGPTLAAARQKAYDNVARIRFEGMHYRRDIALL